MAAAGAAGVIVHARKAWLEGLSPKDNRTVPPLDYPLVYELKAAHPDLPIAINGGIVSLAAAQRPSRPGRRRDDRPRRLPESRAAA